jgi:hypothetical protein
MLNEDFWSDPDFDHLTAESKFALAMLCTIPKNGLVGVFKINSRVVGAGIGWTIEQMTNILKHLQEVGEVEVEGNWVWIKCWWYHNSLKLAFTGNVLKPSKAEVLSLPDALREKVVKWLHEKDTDGVLKGLFSPLEASSSTTTDTSISTDTTTSTHTDDSNNSAFGSGSGSVSIKIPTNLKIFKEQIINLTDCLPIDLAQDVVDELAANMDDLSVKSPIGWLSQVVKKAKNGEFSSSKSLIKKNKSGVLNVHQRSHATKIAQFESALKAGKMT